MDLHDAAPPGAFEFYLGGSAGPSLYVRLVGGRLLYEWTSNGSYSGVIMEATPTPEEWARFRETVDRLGVREWEPQYLSAHSCCDVTYWYLKIELDGQKIVVQGADAYPASTGPNVSKEFREFFLAVKNLVGLEP